MKRMNEKMKRGDFLPPHSPPPYPPDQNPLNSEWGWTSSHLVFGSPLNHCSLSPPALW